MKRSDINHAIKWNYKYFGNGGTNGGDNYINKFKVIEEYNNKLTGYQSAIIEVVVRDIKGWFIVVKYGTLEAEIQSTRCAHYDRQKVLKEYREYLIKLL